MKFNKLDVPYQWKEYFTKYPHGYTIFEALCNWTKQVDKMVDNINDWNDYLDTFVETFDKNLQDEVTKTLKDWQDSGFLEVIIGGALETRIDNVEEDLNNRIDDVHKSITSMGSQLNEKIDNNSTKIGNVWVDLVRDFDIDSGVDVTTDVEQAIQWCSDNNRRLVIPDGEYKLSKPIIDKSGVIKHDNGVYNTYRVITPKNGDGYTRNDIYLQKMFEYNITGEEHTVLQGGVVVGDHLFFLIRQPGSSTTCKIVKTNKNTGQVIKEGVVAVYHGNCMTYNPYKNELYVCYSSTDNTKGAIIDPETLLIKRTYDLLDHKHYAISFDPEYHVFIVTGDGKARVYNETLTEYYHEFNVTTSYGLRQSTLAFDGYLWSLVSGPNSMRMFDYIGNHIRDYSFLNMTHETPTTNPEEIEFITYDGDGYCIFGFYTSGKAIFYRGSITHNDVVRNIGDTFFDYERNTPVWWNGKKNITLHPTVDFLNANGMYGAIRDFGVTEVFSTGSDMNKLNYTGLYYILSNTPNAPFTGNGYVLVIGSYAGHCVQIATNTYTSDYTLYMRKGTASGGVVTSWGEWKQISFG